MDMQPGTRRVQGNCINIRSARMNTSKERKTSKIQRTQIQIEEMIDAIQIQYPDS
jgi:hypothetical protein